MLVSSEKPLRYVKTTLLRASFGHSLAFPSRYRGGSIPRCCDLTAMPHYGWIYSGCMHV